MQMHTTWPRGWRGSILIVLGVMLGAILIQPAVAHFRPKIGHITKHVLKKADPRYVNADEGAGGDLSGPFGNLQLGANSVGPNEIANDAVESSEIADNAVTSAKIADNAVGSSEIATDAVGASEIATNAVTSEEIATDAVGSDEIASNAVTSEEIAPDAVGSSEIATNAVGPDEIATGAVGSDEVADGAIRYTDLAVAAWNFNSVAVANNTTDSVFADCPAAGQVAISGGASWDMTGAGTNILLSRPSFPMVGPPSSWRVDGHNSSGATRTLVAHVLCIQQ